MAESQWNWQQIAKQWDDSADPLDERKNKKRRLHESTPSPNASFSSSEGDVMCICDPPSPVQTSPTKRVKSESGDPAPWSFAAADSSAPFTLPCAPTDHKRPYSVYHDGQPMADELAEAEHHTKRTKHNDEASSAADDPRDEAEPEPPPKQYYLRVNSTTVLKVKIIGRESWGLMIQVTDTTSIDHIGMKFWAKQAYSSSAHLEVGKTLEGLRLRPELDPKWLLGTTFDPLDPSIIVLDIIHAC